MAPFVFPKYYPSSNESTGILFISTTVYSLVQIICISDKIYYLLLGDVAYFVLILFLNFGAYGIGWQGILLDGNRLYYDPTFACIIAAVIVVITFVIQTLLWIIVKVFRKLLHL